MTTCGTTAMVALGRGQEWYTVVTSGRRVAIRSAHVKAETCADAVGRNMKGWPEADRLSLRLYAALL